MSKFINYKIDYEEEVKVIPIEVADALKAKAKKDKLIKKTKLIELDEPSLEALEDDEEMLSVMEGFVIEDDST